MKEINNGSVALNSVLGMFAVDIATGRDAIQQFGSSATAAGVGGVPPPPYFAPAASAALSGLPAAELVGKVKALQRRSRECKDLWHRGCDALPGGHRDPRRHKASFLETFLKQAADMELVRGESADGTMGRRWPPPPRRRIRAERTGWRPALRPEGR